MACFFFLLSLFFSFFLSFFQRSVAPMLRRITFPPRFSAEEANDAAAAAAEDATVVEELFEDNGAGIGGDTIKSLTGVVRPLRPLFPCANPVLPP